MRNGLLPSLCLVAACLLVGCTQPNQNPDWDPGSEYPYWAYSAPVYYQPTEELKPQGKVANDIPIYYPRNEMFFIRHPQGRQKDLHPYIAVWYSHDGGQIWRKAGYYGLEQTHFLFAAEFDGRYWIRFVGPGQGSAEVPPGQPSRIYIVDTEAPQIYVTVTPGPWDDKNKTIPHVYNVGDAVTLNWTVNDMNLKKDSILASACFAKFPNNLIWKRFKGNLRPASTMRVILPPEAASQSGMRFRIVAEDKAGNIGIGMTEIMHVSPKAPKAPPPSPVRGGPSAVRRREAQKPKAPEPKKQTGELVKAAPRAAQRPGEVATRSGSTQPVRPNGPVNLINLPRMFTNGKDQSKRIPRTPEMMHPTLKPSPRAPRERDVRPADTRRGPKPPAELLAPISIKKRPQKAVVPEPKKPAKTVAKPPSPTPGKAKPEQAIRSTAVLERKMEQARKAPTKPKAPVKVAVKPVEKPKAPVKVAVKPAEKPKAPVKVAIKPVEKTRAPVKVAVKPVEKSKVPPKGAKKTAPAVKLPEIASAPPKPEKIAVSPVGKTKPIAKAAPRKAKTREIARIKPKAKTAEKPPAKQPATRVALSDIPEKVQQGWAAEGMTLRGGVSRLLNWIPKSADGYKRVELQFTSDDGKRWFTVANSLRRGQAALWTVPVVTSKTSRLRIIGLDDKDRRTVLETSKPFTVDTGAWETIDMSDFQMETPKKEKE